MPAGSKPGERRGGRKKGVANKRNSSVTELINGKGANPIDALSDVLVKAIKDEDSGLVVHVANILAPYHSPKLTASKIEGEIGLMTYEQKLALLDK